MQSIYKVYESFVYFMLYSKHYKVLRWDLAQKSL